MPEDLKLAEYSCNITSRDGEGFTFDRSQVSKNLAKEDVLDKAARITVSPQLMVLMRFCCPQKNAVMMPEKVVCVAHHIYLKAPLNYNYLHTFSFALVTTHILSTKCLGRWKLLLGRARLMLCVCSVVHFFFFCICILYEI